MAAVSRLLNCSSPTTKIQLNKLSLISNTTTTSPTRASFSSILKPTSTTCTIQRWKSSSSILYTKSTFINSSNTPVFSSILNDKQNQSYLNTQSDNNNNEINVGYSKKLIKRSLSINNKNYIGSPSLSSSSTKLNLFNNNDIQKRNMATCSKDEKNEYNIRVENINPNFVKMEYAVRGPLLLRAVEIEKELAAGQKKPFDQVIRANIGDAHAMGQPPVTFLRQVLSLVVHPSLADSGCFPEDAKKRATEILRNSGGCSFGSYTESYGMEFIRRQVADYIKKRDGFDADYKNIILTAGATPAIKGVLALLNCEINCKKPGIMIPLPQYPLYTATLAEYGMISVNYCLDESNKWALNIDDLEKSLTEGNKHCTVRAICIINPGNPTGQVLTHKNIEDIIKFAHKHKIMLLADEVYQDNVHDDDSKFVSFKKVMHEMGEPYTKMEMASFMSASKGYLGECGIRGGCVELINMDPEVRKVLLKSVSASLCPTTAGQVAVSVMANPPVEGEPSYESFIKEKNAIICSLKERAELIYKAFNSFEGFKCNPVQGALYAFPQITIPPKAIEAAKKAGMPADTFYASELLETSGICIVPGSGFGQQPGTYHFRTTILPQTDKLKIMLEKFQKFHTAFMQKYK